MKRKITAFALILVLAAGMSSVTGCAKKLTPQNLAQSVAANLEKATSLSMNMTMDFEADFSVEMQSVEQTVSMGMNMDVDVEATADPESAYMAGSMAVSVSGQREEYEVESYLVEEDGETVSYTLSDGNYIRKATDEDTEEAFFQKNMFECIADGEAEATLDEKTASIDNRNVYVLRTKLKGDLLEDVLGLTMSGMFAQGEDDMDDLEADVTVYVFTDSILPARVEISGGDIGRYIAESVNTTGANMEVGRFDINMEYNGFDQVEKIEVPADVKAGAIDVSQGIVNDDIYVDDGIIDDSSDIYDDSHEDIDDDAYVEKDDQDADVDDLLDDTVYLTPNADGSYTLPSEDVGVTAVIHPMDGQEYVYAGEEYMSTSSIEFSGESTLDYIYQFYDNQTVENIAGYSTDYSWAEGMQEYSDITVGDVHEQTVNGVTIYTVKSTYVYSDDFGSTQFADIYGWMEMGNGLFEIYISEYGTNISADESLVLEAFERVDFA